MSPIHPISFHRLDLSEISEVRELLTTTWLDTYGDLLSQVTITTATSVWHSPDLLQKQAQSPDIYFGVAKDRDKKIIGLVTLRMLDAKAAKLQRLYIHPRYQRQGIGRRLLEKAMNFFAGIEKIILEVEKQNQKGFSFYRKQGFKEVEQKQEQVGSESIEVIVMEKAVSP